MIIMVEFQLYARKVSIQRFLSPETASIMDHIRRPPTVDHITEPWSQSSARLGSSLSSQPLGRLKCPLASLSISFQFPALRQVKMSIAITPFNIFQFPALRQVKMSNAITPFSTSFQFPALRQVKMSIGITPFNILFKFSECITSNTGSDY